jgi:hypothetical protein
MPVTRFARGHREIRVRYMHTCVRAYVSTKAYQDKKERERERGNKKKECNLLTQRDPKPVSNPSFCFVFGFLPSFFLSFFHSFSFPFPFHSKFVPVCISVYALPCKLVSYPIYYSLITYFIIIIIIIYFL